MENNQETIVDILMRRDGMSREDAQLAVWEAQQAVQDGADPEEILHDDFGLEPDYIWELI